MIPVLKGLMDTEGRVIAEGWKAGEGGRARQMRASRDLFQDVSGLVLRLV